MTKAIVKLGQHSIFHKIMLPREGRLNLEKNLVNFRSIRFRIRTNVNFGRMESTATFYLI